MSSLTESFIVPFITGSFSGVVSAIALQPLDLLKTRVQLPAEHGQQPRKIARQQFKEVWRGGNIRSLWRGTAVSVAKVVPSVGLYFAIVNIMQKRARSDEERKHTHLDTFLIGLSSRCLAGTAVMPLAVIKTRIESGLFNYTRMHRAAISIYREEGVRGLYRGMSAMMLRDAPFSGLYLMFYNGLKDLLPTDLPQMYRPALYFGCGLFAGCLASLVTQPADVTKTYMQVNVSKFPSLAVAVKCILKERGITGFWRGIVLRSVRRTLMAATSWTVYETAMQFTSFGKNKSKD